MSKRANRIEVAKNAKTAKPVQLSVYFSDPEMFREFAADAEREHRDKSSHAVYLIQQAMRARSAAQR